MQVTHTVLATPSVLADIGGVLPGLSAQPGRAEATVDAAVVARSGGTAFGALSPEVVEAAALAGQLAAGSAVTPFRRAMVQLLLFFADTYR